MAPTTIVQKYGKEVTEKLYNFVDKGRDRWPHNRNDSIAQMVQMKQPGLTMPLKWFSIPQCWRYECMTRGRMREHFQWNMDVFFIIPCF